MSSYESMVEIAAKAMWESMHDAPWETRQEQTKFRYRIQARRVVQDLGAWTLAQRIEAQRAETVEQGSVEDESLVPQGCVQTIPYFWLGQSGEQA